MNIFGGHKNERDTQKEMKKTDYEIVNIMVNNR